MIFQRDGEISLCRVVVVGVVKGCFISVEAALNAFSRLRRGDGGTGDCDGQVVLDFVQVYGFIFADAFLCDDQCGGIQFRLFVLVLELDGGFSIR